MITDQSEHSIARDMTKLTNENWPEHGITVVVLEPVPAHHVQDVEDGVGLAEDTIKDGVLLSPASTLVPDQSQHSITRHLTKLTNESSPVASWQVAGETLDLFSWLAVHFGGATGGNHQVSPALNK